MSYQDDKKDASLSPRNEEVPDAIEGKQHKGMELHRTKCFENINDGDTNEYQSNGTDPLLQMQSSSASATFWHQESGVQ